MENNSYRRWVHKETLENGEISVSKYMLRDSADWRT